MYKISLETKIGFGIIFSVLFWACFDGKVGYLWLLAPPIVYAIMYFYISIFIWDKRKQFDFRPLVLSFSKGDIIQSGKGKAIVVKTKDIDNSMLITVMPIKISKYKIVTAARLLYIKISCLLRKVK